MLYIFCFKINTLLCYTLVSVLVRLVVLESGLGLESGLETIFAGLGLGLGLGLELKGLGLGLGLETPGLGLGLGLGSFFSASPLSSPLVT